MDARPFVPTLPEPFRTSGVTLAQVGTRRGQLAPSRSIAGRAIRPEAGFDALASRRERLIRYSAEASLRRGLVNPLQRILVPLDGSLVAESILPHVQYLARTFEASVRLVHVLEKGRAGGVTRDSVEWRLHRAEATAYLDRVSEGLRARGPPVETAVVDGKAAQEILEMARRWEADLVALSSHGHGGLDDFSLGSTAHKIISRAATSVLLARADPPAAGDLGTVGYQEVIAPVDCSQQSDWVLSIAARIALGGGGELLMLHVVSVPQYAERASGDFVGRVYRTRLIDAAREAATGYLAGMEEKLGSPGLRVRSRLIESPQIAQALTRSVGRVEDSLMVVSAHGASGPSPWPYGAVAGHLIQHGPLPLLVLQDVQRAELEDEESVASQAGTRRLPWNG